MLWVGWRLFGKPAQTVTKPAQLATHQTAPGRDSPFYRIEQALGARGWQRSAHETLQEWVARISPHLEQGAGVDAWLARQLA